MSLFLETMDTGSGGLSNAKLFRVLRIVRILRLFSKLKGLNRICQAMYYATLPVCNAFFILCIITAIYSIFGTHWFRDRSPLYFANFRQTMYTMFQVFTGDGWSDVTRILFQDQDVQRKTVDFDVAFFFGSSPASLLPHSVSLFLNVPESLCLSTNWCFFEVCFHCS
jgi:hypothetical protein